MVSKVGVSRYIDILKKQGAEDILIQRGIFLKEYVQPGKMVLGIKSNNLDAVLLDASRKDILKWIDAIRRSYEVLPIIVVSNGDIHIEQVIDIMKYHINDFLISPSPEDIALVLERETKRYLLWKKVHNEEQFGSITTKLPPELLGVSRNIVTVRNRLLAFIGTDTAPILLYSMRGAGRIPMIKHLCRINNNYLRIMLNEEYSRDEIKDIINGRSSPQVLYIHNIENYSDQFQDDLLKILETKPDIQLIISTTVPPLQLLSDRKLNKGLYRELSAGYIYIPPLRERSEDVPFIALAYLYSFSDIEQKYFVDFSIYALNALIRYPWPGDVVELRNEISRIVWKYNAPVVSLDMLSDEIKQYVGDMNDTKMVSGFQDNNTILPLDSIINSYIERALDVFGGDINKTARALKIGRATIYRRIEKFNLKRNKNG